MKFYRENKINPFASCLPLLAQLPVFLSLFYMLQDGPAVSTSARRSTRPARPNPVPCGDGGDAELPVHPGPDEQGDGLGAGGPDRALRRLAAALDAADVDHDGPDAADDLPGAAVRLRHLHHQLPGRPARLLDHDEPVDDRAAGDHPQAARARCDHRARSGHGARGAVTRRRVSRHGGCRRRRRRRSRRRAATATRPRAGRAARRRRRRAARRNARDGVDDATPPIACEELARARSSEALGLDAGVVRSRRTTTGSARTLEGDDLGLFIGRHGQTIDAVQHLAFKIANRDAGARRGRARDGRRRRLPRAARGDAAPPGRPGGRRARRARGGRWRWTR